MNAPLTEKSNDRRSKRWFSFIWARFSAAALVAMLISLAWFQAGKTYQASLIEQQKTLLYSRYEAAGTILTSRINRRQAILIGLAASVKTHTIEDMRLHFYDSFAENLRNNDPMIRAIQFFPAEGEVLVHPMEGNEAVLGKTLDELRNTDRVSVRTDVERAIETKQITLSSPYELRQGGKGVVARLAIYDQDKLLGLAVVVLNLEPLLQIPGLSPTPDHILVAIKDQNGVTFVGDEAVFSADPVVTTVVLPEGNWTLGAIPADGWFASIQSHMVGYWLIGALISALAGAITYLIINNQAALRRTVEERTAALVESEARFATALRLVNEGIWEWDLRENKGIASENCFAMLGYEDKEFQSFEDWLRFAPPEEENRVRVEIQQSIESRRGFESELRLRKKNGDWMYALVRGRVLDDTNDATVNRAIGTITDITERKLKEAQLRESEAKFRSLFMNDHAPMMLISPESSEIVDINPAACKYYGWSRSEMLAMKINKINTLTEAEIAAEMQKAVAEQRNNFQFRHRLANGEIRDVEVFSGPIQLQGCTQLYSIIHDITARKQAEKALEESEERYRQLLELAPIGIAVECEEKIQFINPAGVQLLGGKSADDIIGRTISDFTPPDKKEDILNQFRRRIAGEMVYPAENILRKLDGAIVNVEVVANPIVYLDKPAIQIIATDITERKKTEEKILANQKELERLLADADESRKVLLSLVEDQKASEEKLSQLNTELENRVSQRTAQLQAVNKELEAFSYSVSHDLRAPLRGIDGWSLALLEDYGSQLDEEAQRYLNRVRDETQRMGQLIDDLLRLSRVTRVEIKHSEIDLSELAKLIMNRLMEENGQPPVELKIQEGLLESGDANLLEIMLTNLLSNALKFSGQQAQPRVEFGREIIDGQPTYFVRDNGVGFDMQHAKNLFGAFQRMHKQTDFPGTGIGLATVQRIVYRHGGKVWVDAKKNEGATFYFTLGEKK